MSLMRDDEHGHLAGIEQKPIPAAEFTEHPKWIVPHASHVEMTSDDRPQVPTHECYLDRDGKLTIVVVDADDEKRMSEEKIEPEADDAEYGEAIKPAMAPVVEEKPEEIE